MFSSEFFDLVFAEFLAFLSILKGTVIENAFVFWGSPEQVLHEVGETHFNDVLKQVVYQVLPVHSKWTSPYVESIDDVFHFTTIRSLIDAVFKTFIEHLPSIEQLIHRIQMRKIGKLFFLFLILNYQAESIDFTLQCFNLVLQTANVVLLPLSAFPSRFAIFL